MKSEYKILEFYNFIGKKVYAIKNSLRDKKKKAHKLYKKKIAKKVYKKNMCK